MRILLVNNWHPPIITGSSIYVSSLAKSLAARGHEILVVTLDWGKDHPSCEDNSYRIETMPVIKVPKLSIFYNLPLMGLAWTPANAKQITQIIRAFRPDIIHYINHIFDTNFLVTNAARKEGIPLVGSITTPVQHQKAWVQKIYETADRWILGSLGVRKWDRIVSLDKTVHHYVGQVYGAQTQKKSVIVPFGIRLETLEQYRPIEGKHSSRPQIAMVGHLHPFRNPLRLIQAMSIVLSSVPEARLIIAGRVDIQAPVREAKRLGLGKEHLVFLGETSHNSVLELLQTSHVFASWVTGPYHSLGTAPMEAMLCETPVVSDLPEDLFGPDTLQNDRNIVLVDSRDPNDIAAKIIRLLKDPMLRQRIGQKGREFVLHHLNWPSIARQMESVYTSTVKEKNEH